MSTESLSPNAIKSSPVLRAAIETELACSAREVAGRNLDWNQDWSQSSDYQVWGQNNDDGRGWTQGGGDPYSVCVLTRRPLSSFDCA